jgi:hypothetical protein
VHYFCFNYIQVVGRGRCELEECGVNIINVQWFPFVRRCCPSQPDMKYCNNMVQYNEYL